jgi:hypothetical protein
MRRRRGKGRKKRRRPAAMGVVVCRDWGARVPERDWREHEIGGHDFVSVGNFLFFFDRYNRGPPSDASG